MKTSIFLIPVLSLVSLGCQQDSNPKTQELESRLDRSEAAIQKLQLDLGVVEAASTNHDSRIGGLEFENLVRQWKSVSLDPTVTGYQRIDTDLLPLFISVKEATPYLDGYKVHLQIGNPYVIQFNGFHVSYTWGIPFKFAKGTITNVTEHYGSMKTNEVNLPDILLPGRWNNVELTVTPASAEAVRNITFSITPNNISLSGE